MPQLHRHLRNKAVSPISSGDREFKESKLWPPCSPDITPLDLFLWRYIKDIVYKTSLSELKLRFAPVIKTVILQMPEKTRRVSKFYLDVSYATKDIYVELV